ncbi:unnamed protein product [Arctia plantaginis]|uniref:Uncharacterized protein n=1 Tax=Arctia plantaginis TaxID=874455 RepID=A0A8S1ASX5_ARCPL|nr:unnamed protein product [Arctia plantaginis]
MTNLFKSFGLLTLKFGGVSGYLPAIFTRLTLESDAWTLHRSVTLSNKNSSDCQSESYSNTGEEMASNYPHEGATQLGHEKSEENFKEWANYWQTLVNGGKEGIMNTNQDSDTALKTELGSGDNAAKSLQEDDSRRWVFAMRHGERVDLTYGQWVPYCFDENDTYTRMDLNMPLKLGKRAGGKESYAKDTPLTRIGRMQAQLVGEGLRLAGIDVKHVYASAALRCVDTAQGFLEGLQADPSVKIKVEPGLFEYKMWHVKGMAPFMTPLELHNAGYNVDLSYKPYVDLDINTDETLEDYYKRGEKVAQSAVLDTEQEGGNIIFVGHAATLDTTATALKRLSNPQPEFPPYSFVSNLMKVPYCALGALREKPWHVVCPPCPPSVNSSSGRFDWRMLLDI